MLSSKTITEKNHSFFSGLTEKEIMQIELEKKNYKLYEDSRKFESLLLFLHYGETLDYELCDETFHDLLEFVKHFKSFHKDVKHFRENLIKIKVDNINKKRKQLNE